MKTGTLHLCLQVRDLERSVEFYTPVGYEVVGSVRDSPEGDLTMLKLPDDEFVTLELAHVPARASSVGSGRFVIQVESMATMISWLAERGIAPESPTSPNGTEDFLTSWITRP